MVLLSDRIDNGAPMRNCRIGILAGEGSGPEIINAARSVLNTIAQTCDLVLQIENGGEIGSNFEDPDGKSLSPEVLDFCGKTFSDGGAIVAGATSGRFVYNMRRHFNLYYKLNPLRSYPELRKVCRVKLPTKPLDILIVRENLQGIYQGRSMEISSADGLKIEHTFVQDARRVRAVLDIAVTAARERRNALAVVSKRSGVPAMHSLWRSCALQLADTTGVELSFLDVDYAAYKLLQEPETLDVIVAPNCFGDILSDLGGVLAGSRGLTFGASYSADGAAVYQTNHGAAFDLAGTDTANPVGQIFSAAMMLRETFGLSTEAQLIENSVRAVWRSGWRTADVAERGCQIATTQKFGELVVSQIERTAVRNRELASLPAN
jgi:3-isopropylmalate dehydrogenase